MTTTIDDLDYFSRHITPEDRALCSLYIELEHAHARSLLTDGAAEALAEVLRSEEARGEYPRAQFALNVWLREREEWDDEFDAPRLAQAVKQALLAKHELTTNGRSAA